MYDYLVAAWSDSPERNRLLIECSAAVLEPALVQCVPAIIYASKRLAEQEKRTAQVGKCTWAVRVDITDGSQYIHAAIRGVYQSI